MAEERYSDTSCNVSHPQGWTYGLNEDVEKRRSPHLVHYKDVDEAIKVANRNTASETVRTLLVYGYVLDPPSGDKVPCR